MAELLHGGDVTREKVGRQEPLEKVVVPAVAVTAREAEYARQRVGVEHGADRVGGHPEPVGRRSLRALEVVHGERALGADPLEYSLGDVRVLLEDVLPSSIQPRAIPRELACLDEREALVVRLEDLPALVEVVAPGRVVVGHACVQDEVVGPTGNGERIELDRSEPAEDVEHGALSSLERAGGRQRVTRDEKATCRLGRDSHAKDTNSLRRPSRRAPQPQPTRSRNASTRSVRSFVASAS